MAVTWLLESGATKQSFAEWGFELPVINEVSLATGSAAWRHAGQDLDASAVLAWGDAVKIIRDVDGVETIWWQGRIDQLPRLGDIGREDLEYAATDPWWHLEDLSYQQGWNVDNGSGITLLNKSRVFIGVSIAGAKENTKQTIEDVLTFARDIAGRPIDFDLSAFVGADAPIDILLDYKCAGVIRHVLQWTPDAVSWWDHTTTPPTLHIARRSALVAAAISFPNAAYVVSGLKIAPRPELQLQAVVINMEQTNTVNGIAHLQVTTDMAPNGSVTGFEERAIVETMQFDGVTTTYVSAAVETETPDHTALAFWQAKFSELADDRLADFEFVGTPTRTGTLPRILTRGQIAPWMKNNANNPILSEAVQFKCTLRYKRYFSDPTGLTDAAKEVLFLKDEEEIKTFTAVATDAVTGTYSAKSSEVFAEPLPIGLAQVIYDANSTLHYEGQVTLTEQEVTGLIRVQNVLNMTSGQAAWATMNAVVQSVHTDIESGVTQASFGPPKVLSMDTLVELMRVNRQRNVYLNPGVRETGQNFGGAAVEFARDVPAANSSQASMQPRRIKVGKHSDTTKGAIDLDPARADVTSGAGYVIKPRWTKVCDNGVEKWCLVMRSEAITALPNGAVED